MKRIFCILLALVLGLALVVPAFAAADPNAPIITKQPTRAIPIYIQAGKTLNLEVQASLPQGGEGSNGTLSYAWYENMTGPIPSGAKLSISTTIPSSLNDAIQNFTYYVVVTNTYTDAQGQQQTAPIQSNSVAVVTYIPLGNLFMSLWETMQFGKGPAVGALALAATSPLLLPLTILVVLPGYLIFGLLSLLGNS